MTLKTIKGWVIIHPDGGVEMNYFDCAYFSHTNTGHVLTPEQWRKAYRSNCKIVEGALTYDEPAKPKSKKRP